MSSSRSRFSVRNFTFRRLPKPVETDPKATIQNLEALDQLGPYANEKRMPRWLVRVLENGDRFTTRKIIDSDGFSNSVQVKIVETPGLVLALAKVVQASSRTKGAIFCSPQVHHVAKMRREGSFCGYRNIQMMITYVVNAKIAGYENLGTLTLPSIFSLQEMIERAWDQGFNASGRDELGELHMTRKFIGTSEVEALFRSLGFRLTTKAFVATPEFPAYISLVRYVSEYFGYSTTVTNDKKSIITRKPPIFLQRPGHSVTIVGIREDTHGSYDLIVFDPKYKPVSEIKRITLGSTVSGDSNKLLKFHNYGPAELAKFDAFETVQLEVTLHSDGESSQIGTSSF